jgi:hypothetical protein
MREFLIPHDMLLPMNIIAAIMQKMPLPSVGQLVVSLAACVAIGGCIDPDPCGIAGTWSMTYTFGQGDCLQPGATATDEYTITLVADQFAIQTEDGSQPDVGVFDYERCTMVLQDSGTIPETETTYEVRFRTTETLSFGESTVDSTV